MILVPFIHSIFCLEVLLGLLIIFFPNVLSLQEVASSNSQSWMMPKRVGWIFLGTHFSRPRRLWRRKHRRAHDRFFRRSCWRRDGRPLSLLPPLRQSTIYRRQRTALRAKAPRAKTRCVVKSRAKNVNFFHFFFFLLSFQSVTAPNPHQAWYSLFADLDPLSHANQEVSKRLDDKDHVGSSCWDDFNILWKNFPFFTYSGSKWIHDCIHESRRT